MSDYVQQSAAQSNGSRTKPASRINADVERVLVMVKRIHVERDRLQSHTASLGYFADTPPESGEAKVQPISVNMASALNDLDRALQQLTSAINLFE